MGLSFSRKVKINLFRIYNIYYLCTIKSDKPLTTHTMTTSNYTNGLLMLHEAKVELNNLAATKKISRNSFAFKAIMTSIEEGLTPIRPAYYNGSGKWTTVQDHTTKIMETLISLGFEPKLNNDAPKGSVVGNIITY